MTTVSRFEQPTIGTTGPKNRPVSLSPVRLLKEISILLNEASHWRRFNVMCRIAGIVFMLGGIRFAIGAFDYWKHPEKILNGPSASGSVMVDEISVAIVAFVIGLLVCTVKPYRPDLRTENQSSLPPANKKRSWWTGEPKG